MSWTKRQFVNEAFTEIGLAVYIYDLESEQLQSALRRLDSMMATWNGKGIRLGYPLPSSPENSDLDEETNVPDSANQAIYTNLGLIIAPGFGKTVSSRTEVIAKDSLNVLMARAAKPAEKQFPSTLPSGAGNKPYRDTNNEYMNTPKDPLLVGQDGELEFD